MSWAESLFIDNAKNYAKVLESQWKNGEEYAKLLASLFREKGLGKCRVLDIPCGIGRISVPLARLGYPVTGVDLSPHFISVARKKARKFGVARRSSFIVGRMSDVGSLLPVADSGAAINVFTSIGYGSEQEDLVFFKGLRRAVKKGGLFVIGRLASRDYIASHFVQDLYDETDRLVVLHRNEFDVLHSRQKSWWRFYRKARGALKFVAENRIDLRLYTPHELTSLLGRAGWEVTSVYDSLAYRRPYSPNNPGITVLAEAR